jgi:hypothetical protein
MDFDRRDPMFPFFKKRKGRFGFEGKTLRKNNISLLILDERWNKLFSNTPKTSQIEAYEEKLKELLKEESRLTAESKQISANKKLHMEKIIKLTTTVFEENNEEAKKEMQFCEREIKRINLRSKRIEEELDALPDRLREANLGLLESTVNVVYFKIRKSGKRVEELARLIEETRSRLKEYIDEKELLSQDDTDIYSYFHDLLGAEELERLDKKFFK